MSDPANQSVPEGDAIELFETARLRPRFWLLVVLLMTQGIFEFFDFFIVGYLVSVIGPAWDLTFGQISIILLSAGLGQLAGAMPFAWFADKYGRKPALILGTVLYSIAAGLAAFVPDGNWIMFALLRFFVGVGYGGTQVTLLIEIAPTRMRTILASASGVVAPGGVLMASLLVSNFLPVWGWRGLALLGFAPLLIAAALWIFIPESIRWLISQGRPQEAREILSRYIDVPRDEIPLPKLPTDTRSATARDLFRFPGRVALITFMTMGIGMAGFGVALWGPTITAQLLEISTEEVAAYFVYVSASGMIGRAIWTITPHYIGRWRSALICLWGAAAAVIGAALLYPYFLLGVPVFLICLVIGGLFYDGGASNTSPFGTELFPVRMAAQGGGLVQMVSGFSKLGGPIILALIAGSSNLLSPEATEAAITPGFLTLACFSVLGGLALLVLRYETNGVRMAISDEELENHRRKASK